MYIIPFSSAAKFLTISLVVFITVIVILKRRKAKTTTAFIQSNRVEGTEHNEPMYKKCHWSFSVIHTRDNVVYGYIKTLITAMQVEVTLLQFLYMYRQPPLFSVSTNQCLLRDPMSYHCYGSFFSMK